MKIKHPRLKKLIKRINRGLALGLAIIIVMTVWLSVTAAKVRRETPELRAMTREYLVELIEVNKLMNGDAVGESVSDASEKAMKTALLGIVDKYYTNSRAAQRAFDINDYKKNGTMLVDELESFTKTASVVHIESFEIVEKETVMNNGEIYYNYSFAPELQAGKYLDVWFSFEADVVYNTTDPASFSAYPYFINEYYGEKYGDESVDDGEYPKGTVYRAECMLRLTGRITFVLENGEWKIACTQNLNAQIASQTKFQPITKEGE